MRHTTQKCSHDSNYAHFIFYANSQREGKNGEIIEWNLRTSQNYNFVFWKPSSDMSEVISILCSTILIKKYEKFSIFSLSPRFDHTNVMIVRVDYSLRRATGVSWAIESEYNKLYRNKSHWPWSIIKAGIEFNDSSCERASEQSKGEKEKKEN